MSKRLIAFLSILSIFLSTLLIPANAAAKAGAKCSKIGVKSVVGAKTFTCIKSGNKLVWNKGVVAPVRKPIISPASSLLDPSLCKLQKPTNLPMDDGPQGSVGFPRNSESIVSLGNRKGLVLYVEFPDVKATSSLKSTWENSSIPTAEKLMMESSYGKFNLRVDATKEIYKLTKPSTYYNLVETPSGGPVPNAPRPKLDEVIHDAMELADPDIDFTQYLFVAVASPDSETLSLGGATGLGPNLKKFDGITFAKAVFQALNGLTPITKKYKTLNFTHDIGHLLGLMHPYPDMSPVHGAWDIMWNFAYQNDFLGWNKWKLNWIADEQISCLEKNFTGEIVSLISPVGTISNDKKIVVIKVDATNALAIEVRRKSTFDSLKSSDEGVIVYKVDTTKTQSQGPFTMISNPSKVINCENFTCVLGTMKPGESTKISGLEIKVIQSNSEGDYVSIKKIS
jgi:M6 family metalloprotease-like protein